MAKGFGGLGRGVDALMGASGVDFNSVIHKASPAEDKTSEKITSSVKKENSKIPSCVEVDENGGLWVNPDYLKPNPKQPRVDFNQKQLEELADSIKEHGVLEPIIVEYISENEFYIIAGERRTRASRMAGLAKVPVQLRKFDEQQKLELALIENIQRENLNPIEEATAYYNLIQMSDLSQDEVAKRVGKNRSTVANAIRLLKLPEDIQKALVSGQISSGHARALLMVKSDADMHVMFGKIIGSGLSVREAEAMADEYNNGGRAASKKKDSKKVKKDPDVALFEQELKNLFGVRDVNFKGTTDKGTIEIGFSSKSDFDRIYELLIHNR